MALLKISKLKQSSNVIKFVLVIAAFSMWLWITYKGRSDLSMDREINSHNGERIVINEAENAAKAEQKRQRLEEVRKRLHGLPLEPLSRDVIYTARRERVKRICRDSGEETLFKAEHLSLTSNSQHHLVSCMSLAEDPIGRALPFQQIKLNSSSYALQGEESRDSNFLAQEETLSFTFVSHPFERLIRAYKSVLSNENDPEWYQLAAGVGESTFQQFIKYILSLGSLSEYHISWMPIWALCSPCTISYNVIGRYETLKEDVDYIATKANMGAFNISFVDEDNSISTPAEYFKLALVAAPRTYYYTIYQYIVIPVYTRL